MRTLLCLLLIATTFNARAATYLLLSQTNGFAAGITNQAKAYTDAHSGGGFAGAVSNAVASAGLLAVDATKTNGIAATFSHVTNAIGYSPMPASANLTNWSALSTNSLVTTNGGTIPAGSIVAVIGTTLSAATSAQMQSALGNVYQGTNAVLTQTSTNSYTGTGTIPLTSVTDAKAPIASPNFTGIATAPSAAISELLFGAAQVSRGTLTHAGGNVIVDFALTNRFWSCTITGNVTFVLTNAVAGKWANILLNNTQATNCTPTFNFPASSTTNFFGGAPSTLTAATVGWLTYAAIDSTTNSTKAWYTETQ